MSVKVSALCWKVPLPATEKLVLLRLADFADDQGFNIYPAVRTVADDCGVGIRAVQLTLKKLVGVGILVVINQGGGRGRATEYAIDMDLIRQLRAAPPTGSIYVNGHAGKGEKGENSEPRSPFIGEKGASDDINSEPRSPHPSRTVNVEEEDDARAPDPGPVSEPVREVAQRVAEMAGIVGDLGKRRDIAVVAGWLQAGAEPEADIFPVVADVMNRTPQSRIRGFAYFSDEIETQRRNRMTPKAEGSNVQHIQRAGRRDKPRGSLISRLALGLPV